MHNSQATSFLYEEVNSLLHLQTPASFFTHPHVWGFILTSRACITAINSNHLGADFFITLINSIKGVVAFTFILLPLP